MTAEPSELWTGKQVRKCLSDEATDPLTDFYFFMGDRVHHVEEVVRPADDAGKLVVSDRYADSTRAYQPVALASDDGPFDSSWEAKIFIQRVMSPWNYKPDLSIYLDVSVETALQRSDGDEKYENRQFLEEVKKNYEDIVFADQERFIIIDGEQPESEVARRTVEEIDFETA